MWLMFYEVEALCSKSMVTSKQAKHYRRKQEGTSRCKYRVVQMLWPIWKQIGFICKGVSTFRRRHQLFGLSGYSVVTWLNWLSFFDVVQGRFSVLLLVQSINVSIGTSNTYITMCTNLIYRTLPKKSQLCKAFISFHLLLGLAPVPLQIAYTLVNPVLVWLVAVGGSGLGTGGVQKFLQNSSWSRCEDQIPVLREL